MTGQIPKYGEHFSHNRVGKWHPTLNDAVYTLKQDGNWFLRADKGSKRWYIFYGHDFDAAINMGKVWPSMTKAMEILLAGIDQGFYVITEPHIHTSWCGLQGSGLNKKCTCQK